LITQILSKMGEYDDRSGPWKYETVGSEANDLREVRGKRGLVGGVV